MNDIEWLQNELVSGKWSNSNELITYMMKNSDEEFSLQKIKELKELAETQIKSELSLKYFLEEDPW